MHLPVVCPGELVLADTTGNALPGAGLPGAIHEETAETAVGLTALGLSLILSLLAFSAAAILR